MVALDLDLCRHLMYSEYLNQSAAEQLIYRVYKKKVIELWRALGHSIFNIQK